LASPRNACDILAPLVQCEDYAPYGKDGMPKYVMLKKVAVAKKLDKEFKVKYRGKQSCGYNPVATSRANKTIGHNKSHKIGRAHHCVRPFFYVKLLCEKFTTEPSGRVHQPQPLQILRLPIQSNAAYPDKITHPVTNYIQHPLVIF